MTVGGQAAHLSPLTLQDRGPRTWSYQPSGCLRALMAVCLTQELGAVLRLCTPIGSKESFIASSAGVIGCIDVGLRPAQNQPFPEWGCAAVPQPEALMRDLSPSPQSAGGYVALYL